MHPALTHRVWLCCENKRGRTRLLSRQRVPTTCLWLSRPMALAHLPTTAERLAPGSGPRDNASRSLDNGNRPAPLLPAGRLASATILTEKFVGQVASEPTTARTCSREGEVRVPGGAPTSGLPRGIASRPSRALWKSSASHPRTSLRMCPSPSRGPTAGRMEWRRLASHACERSGLAEIHSDARGCGPEDRQPPTVRS